MFMWCFSLNNLQFFLTDQTSYRMPTNSTEINQKQEIQFVYWAHKITIYKIWIFMSPIHCYFQ